jgi:hypothetical protein
MSKHFTSLSIDRKEVKSIDIPNKWTVSIGINGYTK